MSSYQFETAQRQAPKMRFPYFLEINDRGGKRFYTALEGLLELLQNMESWELMMPSASVSDTTQLAGSRMINNLKKVLQGEIKENETAKSVTGHPFLIGMVA